MPIKKTYRIVRCHCARLDRLAVTFLVATDATTNADENLLCVPHELIAQFAICRHVHDLRFESMSIVHLNHHPHIVTSSAYTPNYPKLTTVTSDRRRFFRND